MRRPKAMALIIVLIVAALLSMLMIAFMRVSHSNFGLARRSDASLRATQQCLTGLDYARNRMQHRRDWGLSPLGTRQQVVAEPFLRVYESGTSPANNLVEGEIDDRQHFELRWVNNLDGPTAVNYPLFSRRKLNIPPRTALIVVDGYDGQTRRHLETLVRTRLFSTTPLTSGSDMIMTALEKGDNTRLSFTNPTQENNAVRSRGTTYMPRADLLNFGSKAKSGLVAGKEDVVLNASIVIDTNGKVTAHSGGTSMASATLAVRGSAEDQSKASMQPGRDQQAPALDSNQLRKAGGDASQLPAGRYLFSEPGKVDYYPPGGSAPTRSYDGVIYNNGARTGPPGSEAVFIDEFKFIPKGKVESEGDITLGSSKDWLVPQLSLGYAQDGGLARNVDKDSSWQVHGSVTIDGNIAGNGALIAKGDQGSILVQGKTQMAQSPDSGVAVYADQGIKFQPPVQHLVSRSDVFDQNDMDFISRSLKETIPSKYTPEIGDPQLAKEWNAPYPPMGVVDRQNLKVGKDDTLYGGGINESPVIRDRGLPMADYESNILPAITGWAAGYSPAGRPLQPGEIKAVNDFLDRCRNEKVTVPGVTIGRHLRIKEFLRSCDEHSTGDTSWLVLSADENEPSNRRVRTILRNMTESLFEEGEKHNPPIDYLGLVANDIYQNWNGRELPDISFRGLIYAGKNYYSGPGGSFKLWGTIASHDGASVLQGVHVGEFYFDQDQLYRLLDLTRIPLGPVSWAME